MIIIKTVIMIYDSFALFEVVLASYFMKTKGEIITVSINEDKISSFEEFITVPHLTINEINIILKGKKYTTTLPIEKFKEFENRNYKNKNVVIDKNIITAKASGYVDFAIELGRMMNIYEDKEDLMETIRYFKYFKEN